MKWHNCKKYIYINQVPNCRIKHFNSISEQKNVHVHDGQWGNRPLHALV